MWAETGSMVCIASNLPPCTVSGREIINSYCSKNEFLASSGQRSQTLLPLPLYDVAQSSGMRSKNPRARKHFINCLI